MRLLARDATIYLSEMAYFSPMAPTLFEGNLEERSFCGLGGAVRKKNKEKRGQKRGGKSKMNKDSYSWTIM
jgi:hypothetical protein